MPSIAATPRTSTPSPLNPNATKDRKVKIAVYCGSSPGHDPAHMEMARQLARVMAKNNISLGKSTFLTPISHPYQPLPQSTAAAPWV